jgi:CheY-like chemotaxis protein
MGGGMAMAKTRILVVEDESIIAADIAMSLQNLGYEVTATIPSGEQAISKVKADNPDIVLMDIVLKGGMDGIEAAEQIRSQFRVPVVFLTAYADEKTLERAKITGPFGYIVKPFQDTDLRVAVEIAIYKAKLEAEREQLISELQEALATIKTLRGLIPICAWCKQIRNDKGYWQAVEQYIEEHSDVEFTHGMCPECQKKFFPKSLKSRKAGGSINGNVN